MMQCLQVIVDRTSIQFIVVVAPGYASDCGFIFIGWVVNDHITEFSIFASEFGDEGGVASLFDVGLYLWDQVVQGEDGYVPCFVVVVEDDVDDDIEKGVVYIVIVQGVGVVWLRRRVSKGSGFERSDCV